MSRHGWTLKNKNVTQPTRKILQHVCWWVNPIWHYPRPASINLRQFQWDTEISSVVFKESKLVEGKERPWQTNNATDEKLLERSRTLINTVIESVTTVGYWLSSDPHHKKLVRLI